MQRLSTGAGADVCDRCDTILGAPMERLFRLQNVATKRAERISSDEEERLRIGYEIKTGVRFAEHDGLPSVQTATIQADDTTVGSLTYGHAATLWRINLGWRRRAAREQLGFVLDVERGYWARNDQDAEDEDDPVSQRTQRVIPYVEDRRNCLLVEPADPLEAEEMASLQAALKNAIQVEYQLEESELAAEPLPSSADRRQIMLYEAAEGGAGVLRHLVEHPTALAQVARAALRLCHFDPDTGEDQRRAPGAREDCEAACYDCLMSYSNQLDHKLLDRQRIKMILTTLATAQVSPSPSSLSRAEHVAQLLRQCGSELEKDWLRFIDDRGLRLPSDAQVFIEPCQTRPDFLYQHEQTAIYIDGPPHDYAGRQQRDRVQTAAMEDAGYTVLRFRARDDWDAIVRQHPNLFGVRAEQA